MGFALIGGAALGESFFIAGAVSGCFALSAIAKLQQPEPFEAFVGSLIPQVPARRSITLGLATIEILVAALLLSPSRWIGAVLAVILSSGFVAASLKAQRSAAPGCGCFGALDAESPHWITLARSVGVLAAAAYCLVAFAAAHPGPPNDAVFGSILGFVVGAGLALTMTLIGAIIEFRSVLHQLLEPEINRIP